MKKYLIALLALALFAVPTQAQKRKGRVKVVHKEESPGERMYKSMLSATAKVMFIDSVVVDKDDFLSKVPLNKESGYLMGYEEFFHKDNQPGASVYLNEFKNRCYFSTTDTVTGGDLYTMDLLGKEWSSPKLIDELGDDLKKQNYPFLSADGITLYFAAQGENSIGGYDIFITRFDSETSKFYSAENYGLPFNSKANDYLIAYDDLDTLGWLVSDRNQPEDKVCIYTFVPTYPRQNFNGDEITDKELQSYANIASIRETWQFGDRDKAMERLRKMKERAQTVEDREVIRFVVNDNVTYRRLDDFRSPTNRQSYLEMTGIKASLADKERKLNSLRDAYAGSSARSKEEMRQDIIRLEKEIEQQRLQLHAMEKKIRNAENILLTP